MLCEQCLLPVLLDKIELLSAQFPTGQEELLGWAGSVCAAQAWQGQSLSAPAGSSSRILCKNTETSINTDQVGTKFLLESQMDTLRWVF